MPRRSSTRWIVATNAPALLEIQHALRASLVDHDDDRSAAHIVAAGMSPAERLDVYRNTFASVLTTALRLSYPAVCRLVGPDFFAGAARIFIAENLPTGGCLDDYGAGLPDFLAAFAPAASLPYLPDVARLEWAVSRALHADDAEPLDARRLAALGEADRGRVRFEPHPSVGLVSAQYPVDVIWRSVIDEDDAALAAIDLAAGPVWLLIERLATGIDVRRLSESAWRFAAALCAGRPLAAALESFPDIDAAPLLAEHLAAGRFVDFDLNESVNS